MQRSIHLHPRFQPMSISLDIHWLYLQFAMVGPSYWLDLALLREDPINSASMLMVNLPIFVWLNSEFNYFPPGLSLAFMSSQTGFFQSFPPTLHHLDWFNQVDCSTPTNRHVTVGFSATSRTLRRQPRPSAAPCRAALAPMTSGCRVAETCRDGQILGGHGWPQIWRPEEMGKTNLKWT